MEKETLDEYNCQGCSHEVQAVKQLTLYRLPLVLVLHLKRVSGEGVMKTRDGLRALLRKVLLVMCIESTRMSHVLRDDSTCAMICCFSSCLCSLLCMLCGQSHTCLRHTWSYDKIAHCFAATRQAY